LILIINDNNDGMVIMMRRSCRQWLRHIEQQFIVMDTDWLSQSAVAAGSVDFLSFITCSLHRTNSSYFISKIGQKKFFKYFNNLV